MYSEKLGHKGTEVITELIDILPSYDKNHVFGKILMFILSDINDLTAEAIFGFIITTDQNQPIFAILVD